MLERLRPLQRATESHLCWMQKWSRLQFRLLPQEQSPLKPVSWTAQQHIACEDGLSCFCSFCNNIFSSVAIVAAFTLQPGGKQNCWARLWSRKRPTALLSSTRLHLLHRSQSLLLKVSQSFWHCTHRRRDAHPTWLCVTVDLLAPGKNKAKKGKYMLAVEPLQDEEVLTDTTGKKWTPVKLLSQSTTELTYEGETKNICAISALNDIFTSVFCSSVARNSAKKPEHVLKLVGPGFTHGICEIPQILKLCELRSSILGFFLIRELKMGNFSMSRIFSREQPNPHQVRTYWCLSVLQLGQEVPNLFSSYKNIGPSCHAL